jgi:hypothetical protein
MKATLFTAVVWLGAAEALAADMLTRDEIARLPFMTAFAYAQAIDTYCLPEWHYASTALVAVAITQADLQDKSYEGAEQTAEASLLKADRSACEPAKAFVDRVSATIPEMQPRMDATLAALEKEETRRDEAQERGVRIAQCGHVVATVKAFLEAKWPLENDYEVELSSCIANLGAMPEAATLLADAKTLLPQLTERIKMQSRPGKDSVEAGQGDVDAKQITADWCARQTQKTALCEEAEK